jgi:hypothetical protein
VTPDEIEAALAAAVERELAARRTGAVALQAVAMDEIRALRLLLQNPGEAITATSI